MNFDKEKKVEVYEYEFELLEKIAWLAHDLRKSKKDKKEARRMIGGQKAFLKAFDDALDQFEEYTK